MTSIEKTVIAGYSGTPLLKKLGVKEGQRALLINVPDSLSELNEYNKWQRVKATSSFRSTIGGPYDYIHLFCKDKEFLVRNLPKLIAQLDQDGMIWVSWPKKASGVPTTVSGGDIRSLAIQLRLVDIKICAIDSTWSGLKLVIPVQDRKK